MNVIQKLQWKLLGAIAAMVHEYKGPTEAIQYPILAWVFSASFVYLAFSISWASWIGKIWLFVVGYFAVASMFHGLVSTGATFVYATQETELSPGALPDDNL